MVIPLAPIERERNACIRAGPLQQFRFQLIVEETIGQPYIDEDLIKARAILDQGHRIMLSPHRFSIAEHDRKGFRRPGVTAKVCTSCHTEVTDPKFKFRQKRRLADVTCPRETKAGHGGT